MKPSEAQGKRQKPLNCFQTVATSFPQSLTTSHGKEGVNGSSPLEGFGKSLQMNRFCASVSRVATFRVSVSTERPRLAAGAS